MNATASIAMDRRHTTQAAGMVPQVAAAPVAASVGCSSPAPSADFPEEPSTLRMFDRGEHSHRRHTPEWAALSREGRSRIAPGMALGSRLSRVTARVRQLP